jgi:hypothetical protein
MAFVRWPCSTQSRHLRPERGPFDQPAGPLQRLLVVVVVWRAGRVARLEPVMRPVMEEEVESENACVGPPTSPRRRRRRSVRGGTPRRPKPSPRLAACDGAGSPWIRSPSGSSTPSNPSSKPTGPPLWTARRSQCRHLRPTPTTPPSLRGRTKGVRIPQRRPQRVAPATLALPQRHGRVHPQQPHRQLCNGALAAGGGRSGPHHPRRRRAAPFP